MGATAEQLPPAVWLFDLECARIAARCAAAAGRPLLILCPQGSAAFGGPAWFRALVEAAVREHSAALVLGIDTGDDAGLAYEALRLGFQVVVSSAPEAQARRLGGIADGMGARLLRQPPAAINLAAEPDPEEGCRALLAR